MAKAKKEDEVQEVGSESKNVIGALFKSNKQDHYNFEDTIYYKVPSSSMIMNAAMGGGLSVGCQRFTGTTSGGKTSAALDFMFNFLKEGDKSNRKGVYFKCEGRLSPEVRERSGITFVDDYEQWESGTCLIIDSNVFEFVFDVMRQLIVKNEEKCKYFFILDSLDMMAKRDDLEKPLESAAQVAGGALLTSVFLKKVSIGLAKKGHIAIFISQIRETVSINPYAKTPPKQGSASGGHAIEHAADWVLEFLPRYNDDIIREGAAKDSKPIGHFAKCKIIKSNNEKNLQEIRYPICYGRTGGKSVWREKEVLDMMQMYELVTRSGAWYYISDTIKKELVEAGFQVEEKYQGINSVDQWLQNNPAVVDFLADKFSKIIS